MKRLAEQTLYEILEVSPDAPPPEIEAAYERVRSLYAPGSLATYALMSPDEAALLTRRIEEARATLLDAPSRARYDERLALGAAAPGAAPAGPVAAGLPPVIPAAVPAAAAPREADAGLPRPAILLASALESAGPLREAAGRPILLDREVAAAPPRATSGARAPEPGVDVSEWTGEVLRSVREARGITIQQIADRTKVTRHHIENIEAERFGALPAPVYLRGILLSVARELRLDGQKVARSYLERAGAVASPGAPKPH